MRAEAPTGAQMILGADDKTLTVSLSELEKNPAAKPTGAAAATTRPQAGRHDRAEDRLAGSQWAYDPHG